MSTITRISAYVIPSVRERALPHDFDRRLFCAAAPYRGISCLHLLLGHPTVHPRPRGLQSVHLDHLSSRYRQTWSDRYFFMSPRYFCVHRIESLLEIYECKTYIGIGTHVFLLLAGLGRVDDQWLRSPSGIQPVPRVVVPLSC